MLESSDLIFYILGALAVFSAICVVVVANPVYAALSLAMTMVFIAGLFWSLNAFFIAVVQLAVYAGAVVVLFVMVLMLFDLQQEKKAFTRGFLSGFLKLASIGLFLGMVGHIIHVYSQMSLISNTPLLDNTAMGTTRKISELLFSKYVFGFEAMSILLLMVIVGAVALSRNKGGTHAKS